MPAKKNKKQTNILEAEAIARYFGFIKRTPEAVNKEDIKTVAAICREKDYLDENLFSIDEIYAQIRKYKDSKDIIEPELLYYEGSVPGPHKKHRKRSDEEMINLHMINIDGSIAEATLVKAAAAILADHGIKKILVKINDVGDKDSQTAFLRETTSYYRKNINELNTHCRQLFKEGLHSLFTKGKNQCVQIHENAPKPMDFLSEEARKKFGEVLEFLETLGIPYEIDQMLLGDPNYSTNTVFEIIDQENNKIVAVGTRYDSLARKCGLRKDIPAAGIVIHLPKPQTVSDKITKKFDAAKFYFLQIGYEAKLKSLLIIDELRRENIPVLHRIYRDRLSAQIVAAKKANSDYLLIMGQKEALSNEMIVRDKESRSQRIVKESELIKYLKDLK